MRLVLLAAVAALAVACSPAEEVDVMSEGCDARAVAEWVVDEGRYSIEASTVGPDCARAVAVMVIRDSSGVPIYVDTFITAQVMPLASAENGAAMQTALGEWIDPAGDPTMQTSSALPEWAANADGPVNGEFPFYVAEGVDRAYYTEVRERNLPMYCYVRGMESMNCLVLDGSQLSSVGAQSFPG